MNPNNPMWEDMAQALSELMESAPRRRTLDGLYSAMEWAAERLPFSEKHLSNDRLQAIALLRSDLPELAMAETWLLEVINQYPERKHLRKAVIEIRWRLSTWSSQGSAVLGRAKPVPRADREAWTGGGPAPDFRVTLSLPYWIVATDEERRRLLHHELGHLQWKEDGSPGSRGHDIEEFADTIRAFGLLPDSVEQLAAAEAIRDLKVLPASPQAQTDLFGGDGGDDAHH